MKAVSNDELLDDWCDLSIEASSDALSEASKSPLRERVKLPKVCDEDALPLALASSEAFTEALDEELWLLLAVPLAAQLFEPLALLLLLPLALLLFEPLAVMLLDPLELLLFEPLALLLWLPDTLKLELELLSTLASNEPLREDEPLEVVVKLRVSSE